VSGVEVTRWDSGGAWAETVRREPAPFLPGHVSSYSAFREAGPAPIRRREGPGVDVVVVLAFADGWTIDDDRHTSFVAGLHERQVVTENGGSADGMQINLAPLAAHRLFRLPMRTLAQRTVAIEDVLGREVSLLVERLAESDDGARFDLLDSFLSGRLADARPLDARVAWAVRRLEDTHGRIPVAGLAEELGWSRRRLVARFQEQVGLPPKAVARLLRFEHARELGGRPDRPSWAEIAVECGYYDQSHLINDFRAVTGRTPVTFFQDTAAAAA
jgi:AraC-like DNA-binding protein